MEKQLPKAWGSGTVQIMNIELDCFILEDGTPVLSQRKVMKALGRTWKGTDIAGRPPFLKASNLQQFIKPELEERLKGIEFTDSGKKINGYHAEILPMVCNVYLEARRAGDVLTGPQEAVAKTCEALNMAFAIAGITALIYEQLGYEKFKNPNAIRLLIESYLADEVRKWVKEFPDEFFAQLDRLYGNVRTHSSRRPQYYAKFIRKYIYAPLEKGLVLQRLDEANPTNSKGRRKDKHHSRLSEEIGLPAIRKEIWEVTTTMTLSTNKRKFEGMYARLKGGSFQTDAFDEDLQ